MGKVDEMDEEKIEAPERIWVDVREDGGSDYDPGCNAQWISAGSWKPADDGENESDWALYVRAGTPANTRQRAERAVEKLQSYVREHFSVAIVNRMNTERMTDIIAAEFEK